MLDTEGGVGRVGRHVWDAAMTKPFLKSMKDVLFEYSCFASCRAGHSVLVEEKVREALSVVSVLWPPSQCQHVSAGTIPSGISFRMN